MSKDDKTGTPTPAAIQSALAYFRSTTNRTDLVDLLAAAIGDDAIPSKSGSEPIKSDEPSVTQNETAETGHKHKATAEPEPAKASIADRLKLRK